jgi:hypothetical protein
MLHSSRDWEIRGILKLLAEKRQCKSSDNAISVSIDPTLPILQKELYLST